MTSHSLIGILTEDSFTYIPSYTLILPSEAYPTLTQYYATPKDIKRLTDASNASQVPINYNLTVDNMRYNLKQLFLEQTELPDYAYVFNTKTNKWYVWEAEYKGWIAFTKLEKL